MSKTQNREAIANADARRRGVKGNGWLMKQGKFFTACWKYNGKLYKRTTKETVESKARIKLDEFTAPYRAAKIGYSAERMIEEQAAREAGYAVSNLEVLKVDQIESAFETLPIWKNLSPRTRISYRQLLSDLAKWYDERRDADAVSREMRNIKSSDARKFIESKLLNGLSVQSCALYVGKLKRAWNSFMAEERRAEKEKSVTAFGTFPAARLLSNPWEILHDEFNSKTVAVAAKDREAAKRHKREPFTLEELNRIFESTDGEMKTLFQIGAFTGCRLGDAACLKWGENVKLDEGKTGRLIYEPRKTASTSGIKVETAIGAQLHAILKALPGSKKNGEYVLPDCAAKYMKCPEILSQSVQRAIKRAGIETTAAVPGSTRRRTVKGFHSLRYTFVSIRANRGEDLDDIAAVVGHTSSEMTKQYRVKDDATLEREAAIVSDFIGSNGKAARTPVSAFSVRAGEVDRADVEDAQKPVFDAVCAMLKNLEPETLKAVASEALRIAMRNAARQSAARSAS